MTWIITILALAGVILNIKKDKRCFIIWSVTNIFWCVYDFIIGAYAQSALFAVYFILAIVGLWQWKRDENKNVVRNKSNNCGALEVTNDS